MTAPERDRLLLLLIAEAIGDIERRVAGTSRASFLSDRDEQALTAFRLSIIGENANKLSPELKSRHPSLPWRDMVAFRNIVAHEYSRVDPVLTWEAAQLLGDLLRMVDTELKQGGELG